MEGGWGKIGLMTETGGWGGGAGGKMAGLRDWGFQLVYPGNTDGATG